MKGAVCRVPVCHFPGQYLPGITVAQSEGVELWEEAWLHGGNLRVELRWPRHGRRSRQQDHSLGSLGKTSRARYHHHYQFTTQQNLTSYPSPERKSQTLRRVLHLHRYFHNYCLKTFKDSASNFQRLGQATQFLNTHPHALREGIHFYYSTF